MRVEGSEGCPCVVRPCRRIDGIVAFRALAVFTDFSSLGGQYPVLTSSSSKNFHKATQATSTTTGPTDTSSSAWFVIRPRKSTAAAITATVFIAPRIKRLVISSIFRSRCGCGRAGIRHLLESSTARTIVSSGRISRRHHRRNRRVTQISNIFRLASHLSDCGWIATQVLTALLPPLPLRSPPDGANQYPGGSRHAGVQRLSRGTVTPIDLIDNDHDYNHNV